MKVRRIVRIAIGVLASFVLVATGGWIWLRRSLPELAGERDVRGLDAEIEIVRDENAIPHIYAKSVHDAYFGLGYVHAQDRMWQLELNRRVASGRLSELVGERALQSDKLFRTLGLAQVAEQTFRALDPETRGVLEAYARGVNAWLEEEHALPIEFGFLRCTPERWKPADSVSFIKLLAWQLSGNWSDELWRVRLGQQLSAAEIAEFLPAYPGSEAIPFVQLWQAYDRLSLGERKHSSLLRSIAPYAHALAPHAPADFGHAIGSNNWAVDGTRTATRKPLLANDPHLALSAPSQWYLAHLDAPGFRAIGATLPAAAGVILGHNQRVAWSFTNTHPDTQDVFVEKLAADPTQYLTPEGPRSFDQRRERIAVRGGETIEITVRSTRHGPVVSDVSEDARGVLPDAYVLALSWVGLRADDTTAAFPLRAAKATRASEFREAARSFHAPAQNMVYADVEGAIGFVAAGRVPVRGPENALRGLLPAPGWIAEYDWTGVLPFEALPQAQSPSNGRIVTANQNILPPAYPHWLGADWGPPYRHDRIAALLDRTPTHSIESFRAIALDRRSRIAEVLLPAMLAAHGQPRDAAEGGVLRALAAWDREMHPELSEPTVFAAWLRELCRLVYADELGPLFEEEWAGRVEFLEAVLLDRAGHARWCDDRRTPRPETCGAITRTALELALQYLERRFGGDRREWTWGKAHRSVSAHRVLGALPVIGGLFDIAAVRGGDSSTIDVGSYWIEDDEDAFENHWGPGFRAIYDLGDLARSVAVINTGQSGHVLSDDYRGMNGAWARGEYVALVMDRDRIEATAIGTLRLRRR